MRAATRRARLQEALREVLAEPAAHLPPRLELAALSRPAPPPAPLCPPPLLRLTHLPAARLQLQELLEHGGLLSVDG